jgi:hypothetical protein
VISKEQAEQAGLDVDGDRAWLASAHDAVLRYDPTQCADAPEVCDETRIELSAEVVDVIRVDGQSRRPSEDCPATWQAFAYRVAVSLASEDENLSGTFYARVGRSEDDAGLITVRGRAIPDLRNFEGALPIQLEPSRAHHAFIDVELELASDGSASGELAPSISYYDTDEAIGMAERIGPEARFGADASYDPEQIRPRVFAGGGTAATLTTYPGSSNEPLVALRVRADAVEPAEDVDLTIWIDGEERSTETVAPGTSVELGRHPLGTRVSVDVQNTNGAGTVRANVQQERCGGASSMCSGQDCAARVEYTAAHALCIVF